MSSNLFLNIDKISSKYATEFNKISALKSNDGTIYIVVKNILNIDSSIPEEIISLKDVPNYLVTSTSCIQFVPLDNISQAKCSIMNPNSDNQEIHNNAIYVYCLARPGENYISSTTTGLLNNLISLLGHLHAYYTLRGFSVSILEYYSDLEFKKWSGDTIIYKDPQKTFTLSNFRSWRSYEGKPVKVQEVVGLSNTAKTVMHFAKKMDVVNKLSIVSAYRSPEYQAAIYIKKGLTPNMSSYHIHGQAVDLRIYGQLSTPSLALKIASHIKFANKIIIEDETLQRLESGQGWIHIQIMPNARESIIENPRFFKNKVLGPAIKIASTIKDADKLKIIPQDDNKISAIEESFKEFSKDKVITATLKNKVGVLSMLLSGKNKTTILSGSSVPPDKTAVARFNKLMSWAKTESQKRVKIYDLKERSYEGFTPKYVYNYIQDEWEIFGES